MKLKFLLMLVFLVSITQSAISQNQLQNEQVAPKSQERIVREVRHELLMLPYFGVFDYIAFKVEGGNVSLLGAVVRPSLKSDAENAVKHIEGTS